MNPPKPTELKLLANTYRKDRASRNEPKPKLEIPPCPSHLDDEAKKEWRKMSKELYKLGLLTKIDKAGLAGYCQAWSDWVRALEQLKIEPRIFKSPNGYPILSPWIAVANKANEQLRAYLSEFGLTPSSRTRLSATPPTSSGEDEKAKRKRLLFG